MKILKEVSFQCKMPVKLITIRRLRLFVARTQINALKRAFICLDESRTKCLIHFIVNLRKMAILDPSMYDTVVHNPFLVHGYIPNSCLNTTIVPICKNKNGNMSDTSNYRPVAVATVNKMLARVPRFREWHC